MRFRHDPDGRRLPVKVDTTSNGEFAPIALEPCATEAVLAATVAVQAAAKRLCMPRRNFLVTTMGAAATLAAMSRAFAAAGKTGATFEVPKEAAHEPAAAEAAVGGDEFIFDVQLHHVNPNGEWRGRGWENALRGMPYASCGASDHVDCFSAERMLKDVFLDSDTAMAVLSHVPGAIDDNPLDFEAAGATQSAARALDGSERLLLHGRVLPNLPGEIERMTEQAAKYRLSAFKTYTQFGPDGVGYWLDDDVGIAMIERAHELGVKTICVHKGIPFGQKSYEHSTCRDVGVVAKRFPDVNFLVYHSGFEPARGEKAWAAEDAYGINTLIASLQENGHPKNVYAELGSTWRFAMRDPDVAAHLLGKLLVHVGAENIVWGTDSIWYGSPQDQIQAFRAFRISDAFREKHGYPELTRDIKRKIFGLNAARVYGIDASARVKKLAKDNVAAWRDDYRNSPDPAFETYGPRTRREFLALKRMGDGTP